jgi:hypothetical protein
MSTSTAIIHGCRVRMILKVLLMQLVLLLECFPTLHAIPLEPRPTLLTHQVSADVERGGSAEIFLEAIPSNAEDIRFTIAQNPLHGTLGPIMRKSPNAVIITYINNGDKASDDEFSFRIKAPGKSWTTAQANLSIKDPPNSLQVIPGVLDFGKAGLGEESVRKLILKNRLADSISGTLLVPSPWIIKGDGRYHLNYGESAEFSVLYAPHEETRSLATVQVLPSGDGPKLTLQGEAIKPFVVNTNAVTIEPAGNPAELIVQSELDHEIIVKVVTDELVAPIPPIPLKPGTIRNIHLRALRSSIKEMKTTVRLTHGEYDADVAVTILPLPQSTNQPSHAEDVMKRSHAKKLPDSGETTIAERVSDISLPVGPANQPPTMIGTGLPHLPTGPALLPEAEQVKLRPLLVSNISYFLQPGLFGWHLTLQWNSDAMAPKEFLIEQREVVRIDHGENSIVYRRVQPKWIKSEGNGIWRAAISPPPKGFQFLRIAPVLEGVNQTVYATFQIQMPPSSLIWNRYRIPAALALIIALVITIRRSRMGQ